MPDSGDGIEITKLDAAQRQLRTALYLWFNDRDPVSIHALLAAAHEIIHRLYRNKGLSNLMFDSDLVKDEFRGDFARKIKEAPNFFKHASHDSGETCIFNPKVNDVLPMFLIQALRDMGEKLGLEELSYIRWIRIHSPELFKPGGHVPPIDLVKQVIGINKAEFLQACELLWRQGQLHDNLGARPPDLKGG